MQDSLERVERTRKIAKIIRNESRRINECRWLRRVIGALVLVVTLVAVYFRGLQSWSIVPCVFVCRALLVLIAVYCGSDEDYCGHRFAMTLLVTEPIDVDRAEPFVGTPCQLVNLVAMASSLHGVVRIWHH